MLKDTFINNTDDEMIAKHKIVSSIDKTIDLYNGYEEAQSFLKNFRESVFKEIVAHNMEMDSKLTDKNYIISEYTYKRIKNRVSQYITHGAWYSLSQTAYCYIDSLNEKYPFNYNCLSTSRDDDEFVIDGITYLIFYYAESISVYPYKAKEGFEWFELNAEETIFERCNKCPLQNACAEYTKLKKDYGDMADEMHHEAGEVANNMTFSDDVYIGHEYIYRNFTARYNRFGGGVKGGEIARELFSTLKLQLEEEVLSNKDFIKISDKFKAEKKQLINKL